MQPSWWERFKEWVCRKIGHRQGSTWEYKGIHAVCRRCHAVYDVTGYALSERLACWWYGHKPGAPRIEVVDGCDLSTLDGYRKPVSVRVVTVKCQGCGRLLQMATAGIVEPVEEEKGLSECRKGGEE